MLKKGRFMEVLLVFVSIASLLSTASGNLQVQQNTITSLTTFSSTTTGGAYTLFTVLSTSVSTVSATFVSSTSAYYIWWTSYATPIATVTNIVPQVSIVTYPVVTVFISVSQFTTSVSSGFDSTTYVWILVALGILLSAMVVLIVIVLITRSPPATVWIPL
jgi:hypothetical protein